MHRTSFGQSHQQTVLHQYWVPHLPWPCCHCCSQFKRWKWGIIQTLNHRVLSSTQGQKSQPTTGCWLSNPWRISNNHLKKDPINIKLGEEKMPNWRTDLRLRSSQIGGTCQRNHWVHRNHVRFQWVWSEGISFRLPWSNRIIRPNYWVPNLRANRPLEQYRVHQ